MSSESASTIVVMNGDAITAGSNPIFCAIIGSEHPTIFAKNTVTISVRHTTSATMTGTLSSSIIFANPATASVAPHAKATLISFQMTLNISAHYISSRDSQRMIVTLA